ncbi:uncharacterized protein PRCAT00002913001 [Priceomyces carsonii]|uniref:uncharacterized protein n=1 Tax=Priceomyces carsonii TaxID=28549 RepID=UPI002EDA149B|nr:unnamed protein product [Priceomyces carsonii]
MMYYKKGKPRGRTGIANSDTVVFSSDEEDVTEQTDCSANAGNLVTDIVKDKQAMGGLAERNSPYTTLHDNYWDFLDYTDDSLLCSRFKNDPLTTSPKRYTRLMSNITTNDGFTSPDSSPIKRIKKRKTRISNSTSSSQQPSSPSPTSRSLQNSTPGAKTQKHSAPKTATPKEREAWSSLFENIEKESVFERPSMILPFDKRVRKETNASNESKLGDSVFHTLPTAVNLEAVFNAIESNKSDVSTEAPQQSKHTYQDKKSKVKMYGVERSFLTENQMEENEGKEDDNKAREIDEFNHTDDEDRITNINDLRCLGKRSLENDEIIYLLEGLIYKNSSRIQSSNSLLILSLIDLANKLIAKDDVGAFTRTIAARLRKIFKKVKSMDHKNTGVIKWLVAANYYLLAQLLDFKLESSALEDNDEEFENCVLSMIGDDFKVFGLLALTKSNLFDMREKLPPVHKMQLNLLRNIRGVKNGDLVESALRIYDTLHERKDKLVLLSYLVLYFEQFDNVENYETLLPIFETTIDNIHHGKYDEIDLNVMKLMVIISTNCNTTEGQTIYRRHYVSILLHLINEFYESNTTCQVTNNMILLSLGYLINFVEYEDVITELSILNHNIKLIKKIDMCKTGELFQHIVGYNFILLSHFKLFLDLQVPKSFLLQGLGHFRDQILNIGIIDKIDNLILKLG